MADANNSSIIHTPKMSTNKLINTLTCVTLAACMQYTSKTHAPTLQVKYKSSKIYVKKESNTTLK